MMLIGRREMSGTLIALLVAKIGGLRLKVLNYLE
jgi:hypothetical protein